MVLSLEFPSDTFWNLTRGEELNLKILCKQIVSKHLSWQSGIGIVIKAIVSHGSLKYNPLFRNKTNHVLLTIRQFLAFFLILSPMFWIRFILVCPYVPLSPWIQLRTNIRWKKKKKRWAYCNSQEHPHQFCISA